MIIDVHILVLLQKMIEVSATDDEDAHSADGVGLHAVFREMVLNSLEYIEAGEHSHEQSDPWPYAEIIPAKPVQHIILEAHFDRQVNIIEPVIGPVLDKVDITDGFHHHREQ
jgi:hypothetical protein